MFTFEMLPSPPENPPICLYCYCRKVSSVKSRLPLEKNRFLNQSFCANRLYEYQLWMTSWSLHQMSRHTADACCYYLTGCNSLVWCSLWACLWPLPGGVFGPPSDGGWGQINHRVLNKQFSGNFYNEYIAVELPRTRFGTISFTDMNIRHPISALFLLFSMF